MQVLKQVLALAIAKALIVTSQLRLTHYHQIAIEIAIIDFITVVINLMVFICFQITIWAFS